jgi:hypothetical protein
VKVEIPIATCNMVFIIKFAVFFYDRLGSVEVMLT